MSDEASSTVAGRYRLDERIGGQVWRGYDLRADWTVAVKMLDHGSQGVTDRVKAVAKVVHPNVAMMLDVGEAEGRPFLVMEFLTGDSLGEELARSGPLPVVEACDLVGQAAAGLDAAHREGVVHGRVDADSLRRAGSGVLKVVGFALEESELTAADDLRALGRVAYQALTGQEPAEPPAPPRELRPEVPAELERVVLAMLSEDAATRPASGEAVRRTLAAIARPPKPPQHTQVLQSEGYPGKGDTAVYDQLPLPPAGGNSNKRLFIQLGAAVAVIAVVTIGMILWASSKGQPEAQPTPTVAITTETPPTPTPTPTITPTPKFDTDPPGRLVETGGPPAKVDLGRNDPPGGWSHFLDQFDSAVSSQEQLGDINPAVAAKAHDKIRKAREKFARGQDGPGRNQLQDLGRDLGDGMRKGEVPSQGPLADFVTMMGLSNP